MTAEVAAATGRTPRQVYREESVRTLFLTWMCVEGGKLRPIQLLLEALGEGFGKVETAVEEGVLRGGRAESLPEAVQQVARRAAVSPSPPSGNEKEQPLAAAAEAIPVDPERAKKEAWWRKVAARRAALLRSGARVEGNTVVVHVDDPGAMSAYAGRHPAQEKIAREQGLSLRKVQTRAGGRRGG